MFPYLHAIVIGAVLLQVPATAQTPARARAMQELAEPPVPSDPLELVTGNAQPVQDVNQRAEMITLLENAHKRSNVRAQPYDLKTTFTVTGSLSAGVWRDGRFVARTRSLSLDRAGSQLFGSELDRQSHLLQQPAGDRTPFAAGSGPRGDLLFQAVRGSTARHASHREYKQINADLVCALIAHNAMSPAAAGGRLWEEEEYCVDSKAGTLVDLLSGARHRIIVYDYSKAITFHGKLIPNGFTISQAGQTIIEAQTERVTDPANNPAAFQPAGLNQIGVEYHYVCGMAIPHCSCRYRRRPASHNRTNHGANVVVMHGMQSPDGQVSDLEMLASSDPSRA